MTKEEIESMPEVQRAMADMKVDQVGGKPVLDMDDTQYEDPMCAEYDIGEMMNDLILAEYIDENNGQVIRGGIYMPTNISETKAWRTAKVLKTGPNAPSNIKEGTIIRFPSDKGIPSISGKKKMIFLNAERIFCTLVPKR